MGWFWLVGKPVLRENYNKDSGRVLLKTRRDE
jgi:hypothetical protein